MKKNKWADLTLHLVFVSLSITLFFVALFLTEIFHHDAVDVLLGLERRVEWETLLVGFGAVAMAWLTIQKMQEQIDVEREHKRLVAQQEVSAVMITLPSIASKICSYADSLVKHYYGAQILEELGGEANPEIPEIENEVLDALIAFVRALPPEDEVQHFIRALSRELQYTEARVRKGGRPSRPLTLNTSNIYRACVIYARATNLFRYADSNTKEYQHEVDSEANWVLEKRDVDTAIKTLVPLQLKELRDNLLRISERRLG